MQQGSEDVGFNEAPIHESGKCEENRLRKSNPVGFNEAPIHESGKSLIAGAAIATAGTLQ